MKQYVTDSQYAYRWAKNIGYDYTLVKKFPTTLSVFNFKTRVSHTLRYTYEVVYNLFKESIK